MEIKKGHNSQTFKAKILKVDILKKSKMEPDIAKKMLKLVDEFIPKAKDIDDETAGLSLYVLDHTFFVDCEKKFIPQFPATKNVFRKLSNKVKAWYGSKTVEQGSFNKVGFIDSADDIDKLARDANSNCFKTLEAKQFDLKEHEKTTKRLATEANISKKKPVDSSNTIAMRGARSR